MNIAHITFSHPLLESYLRKVFKCAEGPIKITEHSSLGAFISRHVRKTNKPQKATENSFPLIIPDAEGKRGLRRHFLYFHKVDMESIEKIAKTFYDIEVRMAYIEGRDFGMNIKDSIMALLEDFDFERSKLNYDQIRRDLSRERQRKRKMLHEYRKRYGYKSILYPKRKKESHAIA